MDAAIELADTTFDEEIKAADEASPRSPDEKTDYWVLQLSLEEVAQFKASGFIPDDA